MRNLWVPVALLLWTATSHAFDISALKVDGATRVSDLKQQLNQIQQQLPANNDENNLKLIFRSLTKLGNKLHTCAKSEAESVNAASDKEGATNDNALNKKTCQQLYDLTIQVKSDVLDKLNQYSFYRYKTRQSSLLSSIEQKGIKAQPIDSFVQINLKYHLLVGSLLFVVFWFALKKLYQYEQRSAKNPRWSLHAILLVGLFSFLITWFSNTESRVIETELWSSLLITASLYLSWQHQFSNNFGVRSLLLFSGSIYCADLLNSALLDNTNIGYLIVDFSALLIWMVLLYFSFGRLKSIEKKIILCSAIIVALLDLSGYHPFAHQIILTAVTLRLLGLFVKLLNNVTPDFCRYYFIVISKIKLFKPLQKEAPLLPGEAWIRWGLVSSISLSIALSQLTLLGLPDYYSEQLQSAINDGFNLGTISISIGSILQAMIVFGMLLSIAKLIKNRLEQNNSETDATEQNGSEAIAAIFWYSAVVTAALASLSIAGFSVQNLALVAGAFSIGIGFGLQNIVSNFVSGLILLIERPIKKGDWIITGSTEGIVKNVNIRATQIQTFDRADIIIPNSDLITTQVTNWMLNDRIGRLRLLIGVAYGSDTALVQKLLLDLAENHPLTISDNPDYKCSVHFTAFGDSSLNFEVRVFLHNISDLPTVRSELNYQIDQAFRDNNIEIPFPQRDLHIRSDQTNRGPINDD